MAFKINKHGRNGSPATINRYILGPGKPLDFIVHDNPEEVLASTEIQRRGVVRYFYTVPFPDIFDVNVLRSYLRSC